MKRIFLVMMVLAQVAVAGVALANPVAVDFSVLGINTVDIGVAISPPLTLNGVTFLYDDQGQVDTTYGNPVSAAADSLGIYGNTLGLLIFTFSAPATGLNFNFALLNPSGPDDFGLFAQFSNGDIVVVPTLADGLGSLAYSGAPFDQASMYFSLLAPYFTVADITYDPVPIPGTLPLVGSGLLGLVGWRRFRKG